MNDREPPGVDLVDMALGAVTTVLGLLLAALPIGAWVLCGAPHGTGAWVQAITVTTCDALLAVMAFVLARDMFRSAREG